MSNLRAGMGSFYNIYLSPSLPLYDEYIEIEFYIVRKIKMGIILCAKVYG